MIADDLRDAGRRVSDNRAWRLCSQQKLWSVHSKKRGLNRKAGPPVHDDLLAVTDEHGRTTHNFTAAGINEVWVTDISEHPTAEGKLYLCAIKDLAPNRIVGYSLDSRMKSSLAVAALRNAVALREPVNTIVHSDRGAQGGFNRSSQHPDHGGAHDGNGGVEQEDQRGSRVRASAVAC